MRSALLCSGSKLPCRLKETTPSAILFEYSFELLQSRTSNRVGHRVTIALNDDQSLWVTSKPINSGIVCLGSYPCDDDDTVALNVTHSVFVNTLKVHQSCDVKRLMMQQEALA